TSWTMTPAPLMTQCPAHHHPAEQQLEPTADGEPEPIGTDEPSLKNVTVLRIATEPEPMTSDQVHEPATQLAKGENDEGSSTHRNIAKSELSLELGQMDMIDFFMDIYADMPPSSELSVDPEPSVCPDLSACLYFPPTIPLLPHPFIPALPMQPLSPDSPSAHPYPPSVQWDRCGSAKSRTPPRPFDPAAPPRFLAPSSPPSPVGPPAPPGSLVPLAPPWSAASTLSATPRRSVPPVPLGSSLPPAPPQISPWAPPWPSGSSVSPWLIGSPPPWLLPLSAPPWVVIMAAAWVLPGSSCSRSLL
ncbi:hypothetical protein M9458_013034, partial [Cirrhinus mrigala]